jgi:hypothetical protein
MLDRYYRLHEWDPQTGWPTRQTLEELDLSDVADRLESHLPRAAGADSPA